MIRAGTPATTAFAGHVLRDDRARADDRVVAHRDSAEDLRAVADPDVAAHPHVALVDPLHADRALDLGDVVVEVDQHHAVGEDALLPDRDVLVGGDRALLPDHGLVADRHLALVAADLRAVPDPDPAPEVGRARARPIWIVTRGPRNSIPSSDMRRPGGVRSAATPGAPPAARTSA